MLPENVMKVALYSRVSTAGQADDGLSLAMQERRMRDYARLYRLQVAAVVRDDGFSGKSLQRPGVEEIQRMIDAGVIQGVVVLKLDRLTRSVRDFVNMVAEFEQAGISLFSVEEKLDTTTASGEFFTQLMVLVSHWEARVIGERTKSALAQARAEGKALGRTPFGYRREGGKFVREDRQWPTVLKIRRLRRRGHSLQEITDDLNAGGTTTANGGAWHRGSVKRILDGPVGNSRKADSPRVPKSARRPAEHLTGA